MSVASADAALLSAARAYASLKMTINSSSGSSSSNQISSTPSTPTAPSQSKKPIYYSRSDLLALHDSPLCVRPPALKPLKDWFGEIDLTPPKSTPSYPPSNSPLTQRNSHFSPEHASQSPSSLSHPPTTTLPVLGRSQPPARNPFANFGKFGAEEPNSNSFSLLFNGPAAPTTNSNKQPRRLIDRDCAPHIGRAEPLVGDGPRRRTTENSGGLPKERVVNPKAADDNPDGKPGVRRTLDRYVPDRDRDDDRLRERERERDREREKTSRSNQRDGNLASNGEDHLNWRRPSLGSQHNNKRTSPEHHSHPRPEKDGLDTRDRDHPAREKDPARLMDRDTLSIGHHPLPQHPNHRNGNQARSRDKEDHFQNLLTHQLVLPTSQLSRGTPPVSPVVPLSAQLPRRVKDGAWDSGEGKWEMSKQANGPPGTPGYGATSEIDAIQTWKAEMKALEAKRKQAGAAAGLISPDQASFQPHQHQQQFRVDQNSSDQHALASDPAQLDSRTPDRAYASDPLPSQFVPSDNGSQTQFGIPSIAAHSNDHRDGARSIGGREDDFAGLPRASRFAKFFDSQHKEGNGPSSARQGAFPGTDAQAEREVGAGQDPEKQPRSASADPENMARVLSMLQMSSKQTLEPTFESTPPAQSNALASQSLNKLVPSNIHASTHSELAGFLQQHSVPSPPKPTPPSMHSVGNGSELSSQRVNATDDVRRIASSAPGAGSFVGFPPSSQSRASQHSSPVNQMGVLDELANHHTAGEPFHASQTTPNAIGQMGYTSQPAHGAPSTSAPFGVFGAPPHAGQSKLNAAEGGLRGATGVDPQLLQLQHMLSAVGPQQHMPQHESQKLAFLSRQLQQHRMMPTHLVNQAGGAQAHAVGPAQTVSLQQGRQLEQALEHQRRFAQTTGLQGLPAAGGGLNPMLGGFSGGGVPMVGGPLQAGPALVLPGGSGLNFLGGHGQGSHAGMVAVNFGGGAGGIGGVRGGGGAFGGVGVVGAGAQRAVGPNFGGAGAGGAYGPFMGGQQFGGGGTFGAVVVPNQTQTGQPGGVGQHHLQQPQPQQAGQSLGGQQGQGPFGSFLSHHHHGIPQPHQQQQQQHQLNQISQHQHQLSQHQQHQLNQQQQHQLNQLNQHVIGGGAGQQAGGGAGAQVDIMSLLGHHNGAGSSGAVGGATGSGVGRRNNFGM